MGVLDSYESGRARGKGGGGMSATFAAFSILELFLEEGLHTDLSDDDKCALAQEIANLESQGFVVDLETCQILEDVDVDAPIQLQPDTPETAGEWN